MVKQKGPFEKVKKHILLWTAHWKFEIYEIHKRTVICVCLKCLIWCARSILLRHLWQFSHKGGNFYIGFQLISSFDLKSDILRREFLTLQNANQDSEAVTKSFSDFLDVLKSPWTILSNGTKIIAIRPEKVQNSPSVSAILYSSPLVTELSQMPQHLATE